MDTISASRAREKLFRLMEEVSKSHKPVKITGKKTNVVIVSEEDWDSIQETLYLLSIPGMRESIIEGGDMPVEECTPLEQVEW